MGDGRFAGSEGQGLAVIRGEHTYIRGTEQDDVAAMYGLYMQRAPRAGLLDGRRERLLPTHDDLRDLLTRKEIADGTFYTIEDRGGAIVGFCSLRGHSVEARFAEYILQFVDPGYYGGVEAKEAHAFLLERAFTRLGLRKLLAHALASEGALRDFLTVQGFCSAGCQRDVLFAGGQWHDLETLVLNRPQGQREPV
jgi:RimJ/RimL family protein N-acetyltransferase